VDRRNRVALRDRLIALVRAYEVRGFFQLADQYIDPNRPNARVSELTLTMDGKSKTVRYQEGFSAPLPLEELALGLEDEFKRANAHSSLSQDPFLHTGLFKNSRDAVVWYRSGYPRTDGTELIVYRDGRVVYVGRLGQRNDPKTFGVHVYAIGPEKVEQLERELRRLQFGHLKMDGVAGVRSGGADKLSYKEADGVVNTVLWNAGQQVPTAADEARLLVMKLTNVERLACMQELRGCSTARRID
jgi:hypothetical protein